MWQSIECVLGSPWYTPCMIFSHKCWACLIFIGAALIGSGQLDLGNKLLERKKGSLPSPNGIWRTPQFPEVISHVITMHFLLLPYQFLTPCLIKLHHTICWYQELIKKNRSGRDTKMVEKAQRHRIHPSDITALFINTFLHPCQHFQLCEQRPHPVTQHRGIPSPPLSPLKFNYFP